MTIRSRVTLCHLRYSLMEGSIRHVATCICSQWYNIEPVQLPESACAAHGLLRVSRKANFGSVPQLLNPHSFKIS
jgi:hypothetical protein